MGGGGGISLLTVIARPSHAVLRMSVVLCVCLFCFETSMFVFLKLFNKTRQDNTIYKYSIKLFFSSI